MGEASRKKHRLTVIRQQPSMTLVSSRPADAKKYKWLQPVAMALATSDVGISEDLKHRQEAKAPAPACGEGCHACCLAPTLLVTPLEVQGLSWFLSEVMEAPVRSRVKAQLKSHRERTSCPFLLDGDCSVYPVRPLTCRQFVVASKPCVPGEDVLKTRPQDVIKFSPEPQREAAVILLKELGYSQAAAGVAARDGTFYRSAKHLHEMKLEALAGTMDVFDQLKAQAVGGGTPSGGPP